jgi:hypothetical protein
MSQKFDDVIQGSVLAGCHCSDFSVFIGIGQRSGGFSAGATCSAVQAGEDGLGYERILRGGEGHTVGHSKRRSSGQCLMATRTVPATKYEGGTIHGPSGSGADGTKVHHGKIWKGADDPPVHWWETKFIPRRSM